MQTDRLRWRPQALDVVNKRRPGAGAPVPACTSPCGSDWRAGKRRPGADDRVSTGSASHRARRGGLSTHAGRRQGARSTGDGSNHCDRGLPAAACGDRSFFYPVFEPLLVPATGHRRCPDDPTTTAHAVRNGAMLPVRPVIPADCVLAGPRMVRCRTGRTPRRRLSYLNLCKERASFVRGRLHKAFIGQARGRNGRDMQDVAKLKHAVRRRPRPRGVTALPDKARDDPENFPDTDRTPPPAFAGSICAAAGRKRFTPFTCRRTPAHGPAADASRPPFSRRAGGRRRRAASRPSRRCRRCCRGR